MTMSPAKKRFLAVLNRTLNPLTLRAARRGIGPFWLLRHTGRRTGASFETPLLLAPVAGGFVAELTYGPEVNWYRNITAAGTGVVSRGGRSWRITAIEPFDTVAGRRAFGGFPAIVLRLLRREEFRLLRAEPL